MTISTAEFAAFKAYVYEQSAFRERECQRYLKYAAKFLVPGTSTGIVFVPEDPNFFGSTDFVIGAEVRSGPARSARHAYIWELKAPQCYLFERDTKHRCRPTADFLQAENQLLHYFHEASGNGRFRERMGVIDQDNIHIGGIVIGTSERMLRGSDGFEMSYTALTVRERYFYRSLGIRVLTWDEILDFLDPIDALSG